MQTTDYPTIQFLVRSINGTDPVGGVLSYPSGTTYAQVIANGQNLVNYNALASTSIAGAPPASASTPGLVLVATGTQVYNNLVSSPYVTVPSTNLFYGTSSSSIQYQIPVASSGTLDPNFIRQTAATNYNFLGSISSASTTLTNTTTVSGSLIVAPTSTILTTNSAGKVSAIGSAPSGSLIALGNNGWQTGILQGVFNATKAVSTTLSTVATWTIPTASTGTYYQIGLNVSNAGGVVVSSSTLSLNGQSLLICTNGASNDPGTSMFITIWMQQSASSEFILSPYTPTFGAGSCTLQANGLDGVSIAGSPTFTLQEKAAGGGETMTMTSTYMMFQ